MAKSTIPFHPLDIEVNRRYTLTDGDSPVITWHYSESPAVHDWAGYWRVEESGTYQIHVRADDNGYIRINGAESKLTGHNSVKNSEAVSVELEKGYHYVELHHENLTPIKDVANAQEFGAYINGTKITQLVDIDAPENLLSATVAQNLLDQYGLVDYIKIPPEDNAKVWKLFGSEYAQKAAELGWVNTCALRVSIALNRAGYRLSGASGSNNVALGGGDISILNPPGTPADNQGKHIIISAREMAKYLTSLFGAPDYSNSEEYSTPQPGDIVIFAGTNHSGMCPGTSPNVGYFISGGVWLLSRATLSD